MHKTINTVIKTQLPPLSSSSYTVIPEKTFHLCHIHTCKRVQKPKLSKHTLPLPQSPTYFSSLPLTSYRFQMCCSIDQGGIGWYSEWSAICHQDGGNDCIHTWHLRLSFGNLPSQEHAIAQAGGWAGNTDSCPCFSLSLSSPLVSSWASVSLTQRLLKWELYFIVLLQHVTFSLVPASQCVSSAWNTSPPPHLYVCVCEWTHPAGVMSV